MDLKNRAALKRTLTELIDTFDHIIALIQKQNEAVIAHELEAMNELAEEQISANAELLIKEEHFQHELELAFDEVGLNRDDVSLTLLLTQFPDDPEKEVFTTLRDQLIEQVHTSQTAQIRLNELLLFAQEHVNDTLRAIYSLSNQQSVSYDSKGKMSQSKASFINKTG